MTDEPNEPRTHERAEELQMEACLTELGGVGPDRALASRILAAIAERDGNGSVIAIATGTPRWLLAAFVVVGLSVVGGIALMRSQPDKQNTAAPVLPPDSDAPDLEQQEPMQPNQPAPTPKPVPITTLIADYSENRIIEIDSSGAVIFELNQIFGAWDVETLANNNLAGATWEQSISTEMAALSARCDSRSRELLTNLELVRSECRAQGGCGAP